VNVHRNIQIEGLDIEAPVIRIMLSVLKLSVGQLQDEEDVAGKAREWFLSDDTEWLFSFRSIVENLNLGEISGERFVQMVEEEGLPHIPSLGLWSNKISR